MRRVRRRLVEAILPMLLLTLAVPVRGAVLNKKARLREAATRESALLGWIDAGTPVTVTGEEAGWDHVVLSDGREGFIWGDHVDQSDGSRPSRAEGSGSPADPEHPATLQENLEALRLQLDGYSREGGLAAKADFDRLLERVDRIAKEQEDLRQSLDDSVFTGMRTPVDGSAIAGGAFLTIGGLIGWSLARLSQRRRDRIRL